MVVVGYSMGRGIVIGWCQLDTCLRVQHHQQRHHRDGEQVLIGLDLKIESRVDLKIGSRVEACGLRIVGLRPWVQCLRSRV